MPSAFPASFDNLTNPIPDDPLASGTVPHATQHTNLNDIVEAMQGKIGLGPAPGGPGVAPGVLRRTAPNMSDWGLVQSGDLADGAITGVKIGTGEITTTQILNGTIQDVDIAAAAAIALSKLAHVGAGNVLKSNGSANVGGQVVNADVAAAAAIALSKIAGGTAGLIKSNGSILTAGNQLASSDIPNDLITGAHIAPGAISNSELGLNSVISANIQDRGIAGGDIAVGAVSTLEMASGLTVIGTAYGGYSFNIGAGAFGYTGINVGVSGLQPGYTKLLILYFQAAYSSGTNAAMSLGIGIDSTTSPTWTSSASQPVAGASQVMPMMLAMAWAPSGNAHTFYALVSTTAGNIVAYGNAGMVVFGTHR